MPITKSRTYGSTWATFAAYVAKSDWSWSESGVVAHCTGLQLPVKAKLDRASTRNPRFSFRLSCNIDCTYRARLEKLPQHSTVMVSRGVAAGGKPLRVAFAPRELAPGRYRFTVRVVASVNPGPPRSLFGAAFRIR